MSTEESVEEKVKEIIVKQMGANKDQVTPETSFINDLGADSLDTVELKTRKKFKLSEMQ